MQLRKGVHSTEPLTPAQTVEAVLHWYAIAEKTLQEAQWQEGQLLPHGDVSTHYYNWQLWTETARKLWIGLPQESREQCDRQVGPLLATFRDEGIITRVLFCNVGEEVQVRTASGRGTWLYTKHMNVPDFEIGQRIYWNTSFVYGPAQDGGNEVLAVLRRPSTDEVECLREQLKK